MARYNRIVNDLGKGRQMLRRSVASVELANGVTFAVIDQIPARFRIRRVLIGSAVATNISGTAEVLALDRDSNLDTAAGAGNRVITGVPDFTTKKLLDSDDIAAASPGALTALGKGAFAKDTVLVLQVTHNATATGGAINCIVEWDVVGTSYGGYDNGDDAAGTYE